MIWLRFLPYALLAAAIAGGWWYVTDLQSDRDALEIRARLLEDGKARAESASQALTAQLQAQEAAHAQRDRDYRRIAEAIRAGQAARTAARAADPVLKAWADTPHPDSVSAGLRGAGGGTAGGVPVPAGTELPAGTD